MNRISALAAALIACVLFLGVAARAEEPTLGKMAAGEPRYQLRDGAAWRDHGRIVGPVRNAPAFEAAVLDATGRVAAEWKGEPGVDVYEMEWLAPGVYTLRVRARGFEPLAVENLEVRPGRDLRLALEFEAPPRREGETGVLEGILTARGNDWIEVKAQGEPLARRYVPVWNGGAPRDGGGPDQEMLAAFKTLVTANLVRLKWEMREHLRVTRVEMVVPDEKDGTVSGVVVARNREWIDVDPAGPAPAERYTPRWLGGRLDKSVIEVLAKVRVGDAVRVGWVYAERRRVLDLDVPARRISYRSPRQHKKPDAETRATKGR